MIPYRRWRYHTLERPLIRPRPALPSTASSATHQSVQQYNSLSQSRCARNRTSVVEESDGDSDCDLAEVSTSTVTAAAQEEETEAQSRQSWVTGGCIAANSGSEASDVEPEWGMGSVNSADCGTEEPIVSWEPSSDGEEAAAEGSDSIVDGLDLPSAPLPEANEPASAPEQAGDPSEGLPPWTRQVYLLVLFLIAYGGISDRLATLLVSVLLKIIAPLLNCGGQESSDSSSAERPMVTPASIRRYMAMESDYNRYAVCAGCAHLHLWNNDPERLPARCLRCGQSILHGRRPALIYAHRPIATILQAVLQDQQNEDGIQAWRDFLKEDGLGGERTFDTLWSGEAWRADCSNPHCEPPCQRHLSFVDYPGNIKITLSVDWFGAFKGRYSGYHTSGAVLIRIDNIPQNLASLDRRCAGIHVVGILPGPKEPNLAQLSAYLKLVTDELCTLYRDGIFIKTARYPEGKSPLHTDRERRDYRETDLDICDGLE